MKRNIYRGLAWLAIFLVLAAPSVLLAVALDVREARVDRIAEPPVEERLVRPRVALDEDFQPVLVTIRFVDPHVVVASDWTGTVVDVFVEPGTSLRSGTPMLSVDGVTRVAFVSELPPYRTIESEMEGPDVESMNDFLVDLGFLDVDKLRGRSDFANSWSMTAVADFAESIGVPKSERSHFDAKWVVWLPENGFSVGETLISKGTPSPVAGEPIFLGEQKVDFVEISSADGSSLELTGQRVLVIEGSPAEIMLNDGELSEDLLGAVVASIAGAAQNIDKDVEISGSVRLAEPVSSLRLPASSIRSDSDGNPCVWIKSAGEFVAVPVETSEAGASSIRVSGELSPDTSVLANPHEFLPNPICR